MFNVNIHKKNTTAETQSTTIEQKDILSILGSQDLTQKTIKIQEEPVKTIEVKPVANIAPVKDVLMNYESDVKNLDDNLPSTMHSEDNVSQNITANLEEVKNIITEVQTDYMPERQIEQYENLLNKRSSLKERLARHQFGKEQAEKNLKELMKEAEQIFGTTDLHAIAQMVLEQAKQNQINISQFEKELNQIEHELSQFETELAQLGE